MKVKHCPKCGSADINTSSGSFEYGGYTKWSCESCSWGYNRGRGIGTGTGNSGTHPRKLSSGSQQTLTETGEYCSNCEIVVKGEHVCTARGIVEQADEPLPQEEVIDKLEEFHYSGERELKNAVKNCEVALTPTFFRVVEWPQGESNYVKDQPLPDIAEEIVEEVKQMRDGDEGVNRGDVSDRLAAQNDVETLFVQHCIDLMLHQGVLTRKVSRANIREAEDPWKEE